MKRVLVAGATGTIGRYVVKAFKEKGWWVRALARSPKKLGEEGPGLEPAVQGFVDDVFAGDVTRLSALKGVCDSIDVVFSCVALTREGGGKSFRDTDYMGNRNLLSLAREQSVERFVYVSVYNGHLHTGLALVKAHEDFVGALAESGVRHTVIRPTRLFSSLARILDMARSGKVSIVGSGECSLNPIHGEDLADVCVDSVERGRSEVVAGGPEIHTLIGIARLAFSVLGTDPSVRHVSPGLAGFAVKVMRPFNELRWDLREYAATMEQNDAIGPKEGRHTLRGYFERLVESEHVRRRGLTQL